MLAVTSDIHCLRDATRGGLAAVINELAGQSRVGFSIEETAIPVRPAVMAACEMLGIDPLYVANEGKLVAVVGGTRDAVLEAMRRHPLGADAAPIGEVVGRASGNGHRRARESAGGRVGRPALGRDSAAHLLAHRAGDPPLTSLWRAEAAGHLRARPTTD